MIYYPNCKINIGLHIVERRSDGYHNIETVFYPVCGLCDGLEILTLPEDGIRFSSTGLVIPSSSQQNLCVKAASLFRDTFSISGGLQIHLHKKIPMGAGLGGGSSDAAYVLRALVQLFSISITAEQMLHLASKIGSDVPFFIEATPALATGRGEILSPLSLALHNLRLVIVKPDCSVNTAQAYAGVMPKHPEVSLESLIQLPVERWKSVIYNDFEETVFLKFPELARIKNHLYEQGALYASLSGSGSALYGLFPENLNPDLSSLHNNFVHQELI